MAYTCATVNELFRVILITICIISVSFIYFEKNIVNDLTTDWHSKFRSIMSQNGPICYGDKKDICMYGKIHPGRKYAVYSSAIFTDNATNFAFDLPLSALAWKRIGFDSIVMMVGDPRICDTDTRLHVIFSALMDMDFVVVLVVNIPIRHAVMLGVVSRMFGSSLVPKDILMDPAWQQTYLITADADIWPIDPYRFDLPDGKDIIHGSIGNIDFLLPEQNIMHVPISYIGMRVETWIEVHTQRGNISLPGTPTQILKYYADEFGQKAYMEVHRPSFDTGWFMDQFLISKRLAQWKGRNGEFSQRIAQDKQNYTGERIDKSWFVVFDIDDKLDAHLMANLFHEVEWNRTWPLITLLHNKSTAQWCLDYKITFLAHSKDC